MSSSHDEMNTRSLIQGHAELFRLIYGHLKTQALRCADNLGIPGAIHRRGGAATISDIIADTGLPQSKLPHLRRLMRVLAVSGVVSAAASNPQPDGETVYALTPVSSLLAGASPCDMSAFLRASMRPTTTGLFAHLEDWFRDGTGVESMVHMAYGAAPWALPRRDPVLNRALNDACVAETNLVMEVVLREAAHVFRGLGSLVDVGGGHGAAALAIARAFPQLKCTVLDLPHVVSQAPERGEVQFVAGDMFEFIPPADAIFLKGVLDSISDEDCVRALRQCKKAICREDGAGSGKIIIVNPVLGSGLQDDAVREAQVLFDFHMMSGNGVEREEHEWKRILLEAGLTQFNVVSTLGVVSVIEVLP